MIAAREAGVTLGDLDEMEGVEYLLWDRFSKEGPSQARTQILLAQIIQAIASAVGGKAAPIEKILPWYPEFTGWTTERGKRAMMDARRARQRAVHQGAVDSILAKVNNREG